MATGWEPRNLSKSQIEDGLNYHNAIYHDGDIKNPAKWHLDSVSHLIKLALPHIRDGSIIVDYGSGTGGSAIELLKILDKKGISVELILIDPLESWFSKARDILGSRNDVHFELSIKVDHNNKVTFRTLEEMLGQRKVDLIISSSTLHLIPLNVISDLIMQFKTSLVDEGVFIWDSGDIEDPSRGENTSLLHQPFREIRKFIMNDYDRKNLVSKMDISEYNIMEEKIDRIFPESQLINNYEEIFTENGLSSEFHSLVVNFSYDDMERFILVPRLSEIALPLPPGNQRELKIKQYLKMVFEKMIESGSADRNFFRSHWTYGIHKKIY